MTKYIHECAWFDRLPWAEQLRTIQMVLAYGARRSPPATPSRNKREGRYSGKSNKLDYVNNPGDMMHGWGYYEAGKPRHHRSKYPEITR